MPSCILLVVSAATEVPLADGTRAPAGYVPAEATAVCEVLGGAGHDVRVATPAGLRPTPEPDSPPEQVAAAERMPGLREPTALSQNEDASDFGAVVIVGGRAALTDLPGDPILGRLLLQARWTSPGRSQARA
jgi:putative intracellular protease/amidase